MNLIPENRTRQLNNYNSYLIDMVGLIIQQKFQENEIGEFDLGNLFVENQKDLSNAFYYKCSTDSLNQVNEDAELIWLAYFDFFFPSDENVFIHPELFHFLKNKKLNKVHFFFQRDKDQNNRPCKWHFGTTKLILQGSKSIDSILFRYAVEIPNSQIKKRTEEEESYFQKYCNRVLLLSKREKEIVKLIVEGKSSHDISDQLFISIHTVNNHRKSIINKLEISNLCHLTKFAMLFEMV